MILPPKPRLRPVILLFGSKWRLAHKYPPPKYGTIIEPFAGGAGYSLLWHDRDIILIEKNKIIVAIWNFLINATPKDIMLLPEFTNPNQTVEDITQGYPEVVKWLIGFWCRPKKTKPSNKLIQNFRKKLMLNIRPGDYWSYRKKEHLAQVVRYIKHWQIIEGDYTDAPCIEATWFIDPPYQNQKYRVYQHNLEDSDYVELSKWCQQRKGQIIVCEAPEADWLPFQPFTNELGAFSRQSNNKVKQRKAMIWYKETNIKKINFNG